MNSVSGWRSTALAMTAAVLIACGASEPPPTIDPAVEGPPTGRSNADGVDGIDDLFATLDPVRVERKLPALAAGVWKGGRLVALGVSGVRRLGHAAAATTEDRWHLGSDTKAMTATLVGLYVERGRLRFEDTLGALFAGERIDPGYANVTLEQLLQHRGGAPAEMPSDILSQMWRDGSAPDARLKAARALLSRRPGAAPGTFAYANAGYVLAGAALERAVGAPWETLLQQDLFAPLGMSSCGFGAPGRADDVDQPWGHRASGGSLVPLPPGPQADNPPAIGPAGTVHCSLDDWGRFFALHLAAARGQETTPVSMPTLKRLQSPPAGGDYAAGWGVVTRSWAGGTALHHSGSNTFWYAKVWMAPAKDLAMAVVTNRGGDVAVEAVDGVFGSLGAVYAR